MSLSESERVLHEFDAGIRPLYFLVDLGAAVTDPFAPFFRRLSHGKFALAAWRSAEAAAENRARLGLSGFEVFHFESPDFARLLRSSGVRCVDIAVMG